MLNCCWSYRSKRSDLVKRSHFHSVNSFLPDVRISPLIGGQAPVVVFLLSFRITLSKNKSDRSVGEGRRGDVKRGAAFPKWYASRKVETGPSRFCCLFVYNVCICASHVCWANPVQYSKRFGSHQGAVFIIQQRLPWQVMGQSYAFKVEPRFLRGLV